MTETEWDKLLRIKTSGRDDSHASATKDSLISVGKLKPLINISVSRMKLPDLT